MIQTDRQERQTIYLTRLTNALIIKAFFALFKKSRSYVTDVGNFNFWGSYTLHLRGPSNDRTSMVPILWATANKYPFNRCRKRLEWDTCNCCAVLLNIFRVEPPPSLTLLSCVISSYFSWQGWSRIWATAQKIELIISFSHRLSLKSAPPYFGGIFAPGGNSQKKSKIDCFKILK